MEGRGEERDKWREGGRSEGGRKKEGGSEGGKRGEREGGREGGGKGEREERGDGREGVKEGSEEEGRKGGSLKGLPTSSVLPCTCLYFPHPPTRPECHISPAMTGEGCHCWLESVSLCNFTVLPTLNYNYVRTPSCVTVKNSSICVACA